MKTLLTFIATAALACGPVMGDVIQTKYGLSAGYRQDDFTWSIAGDSAGGSPNVLSELTLSKMPIYQVTAGIETVFPGQVVTQVGLGYGWVVGGKNRDSDYLGDNRTMEFSRSENSVGGGKTYDLSGAAGYRAEMGRLTLSPLVGYARNIQRYTINDGFQTIPYLGYFPNLNSSYKTEWTGPWAGAGLTLNMGKKWTAVGSFEKHWVDYRAEADWNLRSDFAHPKSFQHSARGSGLNGLFGLDYALNDSSYISARYSARRWTTDPGVERTFFADGTTADTRLNEVSWKSRAFTLQLHHRFL